MEVKKYSVRFTRKAIDDLDEIYSYISSELLAEKTATNLLKRIETSITRLRDFPFSCSFVNDKFLKSKGYRKLIVDNYVAFYIVDDVKKQVIIMRILYGRRKYQDML